MEMLWRGVVIFELVNIPIRLYEAARKRSVEFRLLHEEDLAPIRLQRVCSEEERPVEAAEVVRGHEVDGRWVTVTTEELEALAPTPTHAIEIREFVDVHEIDPILYRRPYYLAPDEGGEESYVMLREAIRRSGKVGITEFVLMHRQHLAVLRPRGEVLVVETLHYPEELIDERELLLPAATEVREGDIRLAVEVVERTSRPAFDAARYHDRYRERVLELIGRKAEGQLPAELVRPAAPAPTPILDLTRRLQESLERVQRERGRRAA